MLVLSFGGAIVATPLFHDAGLVYVDWADNNGFENEGVLIVASVITVLLSFLTSIVAPSQHTLLKVLSGSAILVSGVVLTYIGFTAGIKEIFFWGGVAVFYSVIKFMLIGSGNTSMGVKMTDVYRAKFDAEDTQAERESDQRTFQEASSGVPR